MASPVITTIPTDSAELARAELRRSPIYSKIPEERKEWYIERSLTLGTEAADEQLARGLPLASLLSDAGVEVVKRHARTVGGQTALRSEIDYRPEHTVVTVYMDSIEQIRATCSTHAPAGYRLSKAQALDMHLAHEFFHYLEFSSGMTVAQRLPKLELSLIGRFKRRVELNECSEIAAQAFAKRFCSLKVLPTYYDLLFMKTRSTNQS